MCLYFEIMLLLLQTKILKPEHQVGVEGRHEGYLGLSIGQLSVFNTRNLRKFIRSTKYVDPYTKFSCDQPPNP